MNGTSSCVGLLGALTVMGSESATISAVTIVLFCTTAAPAVAHGAAVALGSDGFVAVVMAAIVRHRPAIHGEGVGSRRWAYGAVSVDMHTQGAGLRAQRPGGLFLGRRRTKRRRRCSTRPRYQAHTMPCGVASIDAVLLGMTSVVGLRAHAHVYARLRIMGADVVERR